MKNNCKKIISIMMSGITFLAMAAPSSVYGMKSSARCEKPTSVTMKSTKTIGSQRATTLDEQYMKKLDKVKYIPSFTEDQVHSLDARAAARLRERLLKKEIEFTLPEYIKDIDSELRFDQPVLRFAPAYIASVFCEMMSALSKYPVINEGVLPRVHTEAYLIMLAHAYGYYELRDMMITICKQQNYDFCALSFEEFYRIFLVKYSLVRTVECLELQEAVENQLELKIAEEFNGTIRTADDVYRHKMSKYCLCARPSTRFLPTPDVKRVRRSTSPLLEISEDESGLTEESDLETEVVHFPKYSKGKK